MLDLEKVHYPRLYTNTHRQINEYRSSLGPSSQLMSGWIGSWGRAAKLGPGQLINLANSEYFYFKCLTKDKCVLVG